MTLQTILILFAAGIGGGILSSVVGGAGMVTYPALLAAGIPPIQATASNLTALFPGTMFAAISDRKQLPKFDRAFLGMVAASMVGAGLGAVMLLATPHRAFELFVPVLLGFATILFALAQPIGDWLRARALKQGRTLDFSVTNLKMLLPVSFYGGYFGAGVGVLLLGVMSIATHGDYRSANVAKNFVTSLNSFTAAIVFTVQGSVYWPQTLAMMVGCIVGGLMGAWLARIIPRHVMRVGVTAVGALLTGYFAWLYWF